MSGHSEVRDASHTRNTDSAIDNAAPATLPIASAPSCTLSLGSSAAVLYVARNARPAAPQRQVNARPGCLRLGMWGEDRRAMRSCTSRECDAWVSRARNVRGGKRGDKALYVPGVQGLRRRRHKV
eukprot:365765-Chlamydomonas_euryale.AAC.5